MTMIGIRATRSSQETVLVIRKILDSKLLVPSPGVNNDDSGVEYVETSGETNDDDEFEMNLL